MTHIKEWWKTISKRQRIEFTIAFLTTIIFIIQIPYVYAWFTNRREAARFERIDRPNSLYITAAHREDAINFVMDDINVNGKWIDSDGNEEDAKYQDYVFSVAGERIDTFTLQLAHTTNNQYKYEIFLAERYEPEGTDIEGKDYITYTVMNDTPEDVPYESDDIRTGTVLKYRPKMIEVDDVWLPLTLNRTLKTDPETSEILETNVYNYGTGSSVTFNGAYLNGTDGGTANTSLRPKSYDRYTNVEPHANALYWQCTNIPGGDSTTNEAFYVEFILRVYFNGNSTAYKDTDIIYLTASGTN